MTSSLENFILTNETINTIYTSLRENDEFEISFLPKENKLNYEKFITLLKYFKYSRKRVEKYATLNVAYNYNHDNLSSYRISISDLDNINKFINENNNRDNNVIFTNLYTKYSTKKYNYMSGINKEKNKNDMVIVETHGLKLRKSTENDLLLNLDITFQNTHKNYVVYRYIQRTSMFIEETKDYVIRVDLSYVQSSKKIGNIDRETPMIELEIDLTLLKNLTKAKLTEISKTLLDTYINITKVLQKSNTIIEPTIQQNLKTRMFELLFPDKSVELRDLPAMQAQAAEIQHIVDYINHDYCVTDKADGERYFMFIVDGRTLLISNTLEVKEIESQKNVSEYNNSIFDGEYVFIDKQQKFVYLIFDCLMFKGTDMRTEKTLLNRLEKCKEFTERVYSQKHTFKKYNGDPEYEKIKKYYLSDIEKYLNELNEKIHKDKSSNIVVTKYFAFPQGVHYWEVFLMTHIFWMLYKNTKINYPYNLDGAMLTPISQIYTRNLRDTKHKIYKIKPRSHNSLDFYITFQKDPITNAIVNVFNDAEANEQILSQEDLELKESEKVLVRGNLYAIAYLHVGKIVGNSEQPVLFHEDTDHHNAFLTIVDGNIRDIEGNIIQDKTVVEFSYKNDMSIPIGFRWTPLRTRYDKTESVNVYKRKYGNNNEIAEKTWRSIIDGIEMSDIELLSNPLTYKDHHEKLKSRITTGMIEKERRESAYYNLINNDAQGLRHFHNWIKSNLIVSYCGTKLKERLDVLDYAVGRGGDMGKYYMARVKSLVGFDIDYFGIYSGSDSALSRYEKNFKIKMNVINTSMSFLVADGGVLLNKEDQVKALPENSETNINTLVALFDNPKPKLYDVISCHFAVHYFFKNDDTLNNFMKNIQKFSKPSCYVLLTTFDDEIVNNDLQKGITTSYYTTQDGEKKVIFDIIKRYEGTEIKNITGQAIDVHLPSFDEDKYFLEYIVPKQLLISKMNEHGFSLIETDLFWNTFEKHKMFFNEVIKYEDNVKTKKYYMEVKEYYNVNDEMNKSCYEFTKKNRYYVFQKNQLQKTKK